MEIQKSENPNNIKIPRLFIDQRWSIDDFNKFILNRNPILLNRKYFTQLDLISDYTTIILQFVLSLLAPQRQFKYSIKKHEVDEQLHTIQFVFVTEHNLQLPWKTLMIQMDKIIKINLKYLDRDVGKFQTLDSFWFNHQPYLNQKISNTYKIVSIKDMDPKNSTKSQLNALIIARILQSFSQKAPQIQVQSQQMKEQSVQINHIKIINHFDNLKFFNLSEFGYLGQNFYEILGSQSNMIKICSFLSIRQILKLKLMSRFAKKYLIVQDKVFFKQLYENIYGKTGFDLNQMNWGKLMDKKRASKRKPKINNNPLLIQGPFRAR